MNQQERKSLDSGFFAAFGCQPQRYFSAPGRTELSGNHTDHQHGRVLAAAVAPDTKAAVRKNGSDTIRVLSEGYPICEISLRELGVLQSEINTTPALIRGVAARFSQLGCPVGGFDAYVRSTVLPGSGLSSSAAFEVLMGTIINHLFFDAKLTLPEVAMVGQYAENVYFGKPCGLMDQMASAVGGIVSIDFEDPEKPVIRPVDFDFSACGHTLCIIDTRASHADLTDDYAAIPGELKALCGYFGKAVLRQVDEDAFYEAIPALRQQFGDRAVLRAIHIFDENRRVSQQVEALETGDFPRYLQLMRQSGESSWTLLQNVTPAGATAHQDVAVALALCRRYLEGRGGYRVHGGGFAGTVQAFVPNELLDAFREGIDKALGQGACHIFPIRAEGGVEIY